jgi:hypothetical protein
MADKTMADYLSVVSPDYSTTVFNVNCHDVIETDGSYNQIVHKPDGGQSYIVTLNDDADFYVTLKWISISSADKSTIFDFYFDPLKAKGLARSILWTHPEESVNYVVRFVTKITKRLFTSGLFNITGLTLQVIGKQS